MPWDWVTFPQYLDSLDRTPKAINILPYVPAGPMLVEVLGLDDAKAGRMPTSAHQVPDRRSLPTETLTEQVRDNQWITYEEAHRRLSTLPAHLAGFTDRGVLRAGVPADVVV